MPNDDYTTDPRLEPVQSTPVEPEQDLIQKEEADPDKVSPKVLAGVAATIFLAAVATFLAAITPEMLTGIGVYAVPAALGIGALAQGITGYLKGDPARTGYVPRHRA